MIRSGVGVKTVQTIMRHSDIRQTMDRIGRLFPCSETVPFRATGCDENTSATNLPIPSGMKKPSFLKVVSFKKLGFK